MPSSRKPPAFVNIHGAAWKPGESFLPEDVERERQQARPMRGESRAAGRPEADEARVLDALVLAGWERGVTSLVNLLRALGWRHSEDRWFALDDVREALRALARQHQARVLPGDVWAATPAAMQARASAVLGQPEATLREAFKAWLWAVAGRNGAVGELPRGFSLRRRDDAVAVSRLLLLAGLETPQLVQHLQALLMYFAPQDVLTQVLAELDAWRLLDRLSLPTLQLLAELVGLTEQPPPAGFLRRAQSLAAALPPRGAGSLRVLLAQRRVHVGGPDQAAGAASAAAAAAAADLRALLLPDAVTAVYADTIAALAQARAGRFTEAVQAFPPAWKALTAELGRRSGVLPLSLLQWALLAHMAQPDAAAWAQAQKFAISQSGRRKPDAHEPWGLWVHALAVRLGDARAEPEAFRHRSAVLPGQRLDAEAERRLLARADREADAVVLAAWLAHVPKGWDAAELQALSDRLHTLELHWKADLLAQACHQLNLPVPQRPAAAPPPWPVAFFQPRQEAWRDALAAITALGGQGKGTAASSEQPLATLQWHLTLDAAGRVADLQALEPAATTRGRPRPVSLQQLKKRTRLDPRDAAVARCLRVGRFRSAMPSLDLVQAAQALVGHPALWLSHEAAGKRPVMPPEGPVELAESLPVLEVRREGGAAPGQGVGPRAGKAAGRDADPDPQASTGYYRFRLLDPLLADEPPDLRHHFDFDDSPQAEAERRDSLRIVRDSAERARLIRISPAQRRVAELVAQRWTVPLGATAELDAALRVLSGHFVLHSDAEAGEPVPADARLLARLQPRGEGVALQLLVRPFGVFGPALPPGQGRGRLITLHQGVSLATERDLAAEQAHAEAVLQRLPFLAASVDELPPDATWQIEEAEEVLAAVHALGELAAAGQALRALEWPQGKPIRVLAPEARAFATQLKSRSGWFELEGELRLDEQRVLSLQQLLGLLREAQGSRYIALGQGQYLRLTEQLRQRLAELQALAEAHARQVKLGATAAAWLAEAAPELGLQGDPPWRRRAEQLERAAALQPEVPAGLQAALRPYQTEGYAWMRRLAEAGFGGILADDMGLGKTVQTLALLLARAGHGPALVVAPTSVCDNWVAEAQRFAPGLACSVYGREGSDRAQQVNEAAAGDVRVVSYALLLRDAEALSARPWATLVLDEAQALKNAATQRVQAVGALQADFRLALSGTPVENRLADLWSLMNLINPGLLGSAARFQERFAGPIERQRNEAARSRLRRLVSPFLLRRTKAQVLTDLPPRTEIVHRVEPDGEERAFLEAMRREALERIAQLNLSDGHQSRFNVLAELTRLRRAACDPRLVAPELGRVGAKLQAFERLAQELVDGRHQALVFSQFTDFLKLLAERLDAAGLRYAYLDGSTPAPVRSERVAAFQRGEAELFLISLKAGGFGLNLTAADYVIIADPWWNPAAEDQAMGRAHRMGQQRPVTVYRLVTAGSVEERIVALHHDKRELAEGLLGGQEGGTPLAAAELVDLLREVG